MKGIWEKTLGIIKDYLSKPSFETWFKTTEVIEEGDEKLKIGVISEFAKDWLRSNYLSLIKEVLRAVAGKDIEVEFVVIKKDEEREELKIEQKNSFGLNENYTFENFVVGESNKLAHAASLAVAKNPGRSYNPLFIYGGVGLGKTHLIQAIGHYIIKTKPALKVVYITSEVFTNEVINSIQKNKMNEFHEKYRNIDCLLIDDIQFLAGKERTQEEFFHTFNTLHNNYKQIVITSDRIPKEIPTLEDRLRSRFEWGLMVDIAPPDFETRVAILKKKAEKEKIFVPDEVFNFIAEKITSNIRELEGALIRILAHASLSNQEITLDYAKKILSGIYDKVKKIDLSPDKIKSTVADYFSLSVKDLEGERRSQDYVVPRQIAMYLIRELTNYSLPQIGEIFGGRDHSTVLHSIEKIKKELKKDENLRACIEDLKRLLIGE
ncbi:MAG: chromosomal replication initiator protein DnaA [Caldisericia bacterium]|jgi:chromosomal replication initiator protein|nr:chromosomal replication initiator protein DnaA [Caldisericia bacterium]